MRLSSPFLKVIQQLPTSSSLSSCHFYPPLYLSFSNPLQKAISTQNVTSPVRLPFTYFINNVLFLRSQSEWFPTAGVHKSLATKFCKVAPNICGSSLGNFLYFTLLAQNVQVAPNFGEIFAPLSFTLTNNAVRDHGDYASPVARLLPIDRVILQTCIRKDSVPVVPTYFYPHSDCSSSLPLRILELSFVPWFEGDGVFVFRSVYISVAQRMAPIFTKLSHSECP